MAPFIYLPVSLYLLFAGVFIQQGFTNVLLMRTRVLRSRPHLVYFAFASAAFCLCLLLVLLAPQFGFSPSQIRISFFGCWLIAPAVGYLYALTLAEHLDIPRKRIRWITVSYLITLVATASCGILTLITGKGILFSHQRGECQSIIDLHLGGVFSPNTVTVCMVGVVSCIVVSSSIFFVREALRKDSSDISLIIGMLLTACAILVETIGYVCQWSKTFSLLPVANAIEVLRLTYLETIETGQHFEQSRVALRRSQTQLKTHLSALAHDVRTPLTSLKVGLGRMEREYKADPLPAELASEVEYMHVVFSNVLALFELELSDTTPTLSDIDIRTLVEQLATRFGYLADERGINISLADEPETFRYTCNPTILEQTLANLIYSAVVHARRHIAIATFTEGSDMVVKILDDRPRADPVELSRLSDRTAHGRPDNKGWELGMAIAHGFATVQGGTLSLSAEEDGSTCAELRLPCPGS